MSDEMETPAPAVPEPLFRIAWENRSDSSRTGQGTKQLPDAEARALCAELNRDYPHIYHWVEPTSV